MTPDLLDGAVTQAATARAAAAEVRATIRELCREFQVTARTLRFYEEKGLVSPLRRGQERLYGRRDRARLRYVLMGRSVGFSLDEIREMLDLYDLGDRQATQLKVAYDKFGERLARLERQKQEIDNAIAELAHARKMMAGMLALRERSANRPEEREQR
ncbi:MAG TPA: MerR family DNA-binding transcriptional regulator [Xanthobacteraceae bacterium]